MGEAKARLHEYCKKNNFKIDYHIDVEGPPHDPVFTVAISINNRLYDSATGKSKKETTSNAAVQVLKTIEQELQRPSSSANISEVSPVVNYISWLNEYKLKNNVFIEYIGGKEAHVPIFSAACKIGNKVFPKGTGGTKQAAKLNAAKLAYEELNIQPMARADAASSQMQRPLPSSSPQASQVPPSSANISEISPVVNHIGWLNEYKLKNNVSIEYILEKEVDVPIFSIACKIGNKVFSEGTGGTKQAAKLNAAKLAYEELNIQPMSSAEPSHHWHPSEPSATSSNNSIYMPLSNSQEVLESTEKFDQKETGFTSNTSDSVIFQHSGASSNATDSGHHSVDRLNDALAAVKLDETSSLASPKGPGIKPKRKTPLAPKFSNLVQKESQYTINQRFLQDYGDIKRIGAGGFGNVFKAKHLIAGSIHAIKRVALSWLKDEVLNICGMEEQLKLEGMAASHYFWTSEEEENEEETKGEEAEREVQVLEKLVHENIVRYYTCWIGKDSVPSSDSSDDSLGRSCKCLFIEMEFCEKGTLAAWISKTRNTQSHEDSLKKFQQIVEGVHYIHSQNIIHRDLKPANIFISKDNKIKIGDFGLATSCIDDLLVPRTANKGTKRYMAPEQFGNTYGKEVDLYPLGLIFFELVYVFSTDCEKIMEWENIRVCKFPEAFVKKFPTEKCIISKLLSENPVERPSATTLLDILKNNVQRVHTC